MTVSNERLDEMLAGLDNFAGNYTEPQPIDTMRSLLAELRDRRASPSGVEVKEAEPVAYMLPVTHEVLGQTGWAFYSRSPDPKEYEPGEYEAHVKSIKGAIPLFTSPVPNGVAVTDEMVERAARNIAKRRGETSPWEQLPASVREDFLFDARSALLAALEGGSQT